MSSFPASHVSNTSLVSSPAGPLGNTRSEPVISEENGGPTTESFFSPMQQQQQVSPVSSDMDAVPASVVATRDKSKLSPGNNSTTDSLRHSYHLSELNYHTSLKERVGSLFDSLKFADVTFVIGEGEESVELVAHKLILAISSPVFAAMFYGSLKCEDRVIITDCRADAFRNMLQFAYKSELLVADTQLALDVLYAARKYSMRLLEDECMIYLCGHVTHESVLAVREAAEKYHFPILESICDEYIEQNSYQVLKFHYPFLPIDSLEQFISSDHLTIEEVDLFRILLDWAALECERQELEESPQTLRKVLNPLIHEIRFPLMSAAEMADSVVPTGVLTTEEVAAILTYISATDKHGVTQVLAFPTRGRVQKKPVILSSSPSNNSGGAAGSSGTGNQRAINQSLEDTTWIGRSPRNHVRSKRKNRQNR